MFAILTRTNLLCCCCWCWRFCCCMHVCWWVSYLIWWHDFLLLFLRLTDVVRSHPLLRAWHCLKVNYLSSFMFNFFSLSFTMTFSFCWHFSSFVRSVTLYGSETYFYRITSLAAAGCSQRLNCEISILGTRCKMDISYNGSFMPTCTEEHTLTHWYTGLFIYLRFGQAHKSMPMIKMTIISLSSVQRCDTIEVCDTTHYAHNNTMRIGGTYALHQMNK